MFHLPSGSPDNSTQFPDSVYLPHNRLVGRSGSTLLVLDPNNLQQPRQLTLAGDGRLDLTADGRFLAWVTDQPPRVQIVEVATGKLVREVPLSSPAESFALSPDGSVFLYSLGQSLHRVPLDGGPMTTDELPQASCCALAISSSASEAVLASNMGQVLLFDLTKNRMQRSLQAPYAFDRAEFVPASGAVLLASNAGDVLLWNPQTTSAPRRLGRLDGRITGFSFAPTPDLVWATTNLGTLGWFSLTAASPELATTTWIEATQSWLTLSHDDRFVVNGDPRTPLGIANQQGTTWKAAAEQPGFVPNLLEELLGK
jgi:hypothetical protein